MVVKELDGKYLEQMILQAATHLSQNKENIDALNVFPVPDGDTGTNMHLTLSSGASEVKKAGQEEVGKIASRFSKGLLMGARGNSGVILSQLFRGFAKAIEKKKTLHSVEFALALQKGVEAAYKAVMKPVEGTILTVAKDAANKAVTISETTEDIVTVMTETLAEAKQSLEGTPELLPVLKEVGVVDSGGQGLVVIYEAFLAALEGKKLQDVETDQPSMDEMIRAEHHKRVQSHLSAEDIKYGYCTEFMVKFNNEKLNIQPYQEEDFRKTLSEHGDSLLVVSDEELVKVHIHSEQPGALLTYAQTYGELINIKIENMREQHSQLVKKEKNEHMISGYRKQEPYGFVTVAAGKGLIDLFNSLGATEVVHGGQTMNPSTEDILQAIKKVSAETIFILPNNGNIVMAARQAAEVADGKVIVIPTKTIPQGMAALFAFEPEQDVKANEDAMSSAIQSIKSGQVTYAVRDTVIDGIEIKKDDYLSIFENNIVSTSSTNEQAARQLIQKMVSEESELITIFYGEDVIKTETEQLVAYINKAFPDVEIEIHDGKQPVYSYIIAVE